MAAALCQTHIQQSLDIPISKRDIEWQHIICQHVQGCPTPQTDGTGDTLCEAEGASSMDPGPLPVAFQPLVSYLLISCQRLPHCIPETRQGVLGPGEGSSPSSPVVEQGFGTQPPVTELFGDQCILRAHRALGTPMLGTHRSHSQLALLLTP